MASEKESLLFGIDERLSNALIDMLNDGEKPVAGAEGDQGQAVLLTDTRVIVIKMGLAATGQINGQRFSETKLEDIKAVRLRKGPIGAIIQISSGDDPPINTIRPPDNVAVFSGPQRIKKCESLANKIEASLGRAVERYGYDNKKQTTTQIDVENTQEQEETPAKPVKRRFSRKKKEETVEAVVENIHIEAEDITLEPTDVPEEVKAEFEPVRPVFSAPESFGTEEKEESEDITDTTVTIDAQIEAAAEEVENIEDTKPASKPKREHRSLADEIYADMVGYDPKPHEVESAPHNEDEPEFLTSPPAYMTNKSNNETITNQPESIENIETEKAPFPELEADSEKSEENKELVGVSANTENIDNSNTPEQDSNISNPNPRLPKPVKKKKSEPYALIGMLLVILIMGMAIIMPIRQMNKENDLVVNTEEFTQNASVLRSRLNELDSYLDAMNLTVNRCKASSNAILNAAASNDKASLQSAVKKDVSDSAWESINNTQAPVGLAGARDKIITGLFMQKTAVANISSSLRGIGYNDMSEYMSALRDSQKKLDEGIADIEKIKAEIESDLSKSIKQSKKQSGKK